MNKSNENFLIVQNAINMSPKEAFEVLLGEDDLLKPYAVINIDEIKNQHEADLFVFHLTDHPNSVREACALALVDLCTQASVQFFQTHEIISAFCDALCDINPNICRSIVEILRKNPCLAELLLPLNIERIEDILKELKICEKEPAMARGNRTKSKKNHAKNKKIFNLYWCLEMLGETGCIEPCRVDKIINIARVCADFYDYTIREKTAKILSKIPNAPSELLQKLKNDENFYVKISFYDKIS